jgi:hypothetical protein
VTAGTPDVVADLGDHGVVAASAAITVYASPRVSDTLVLHAVTPVGDRVVRISDADWDRWQLSGDRLYDGESTITDLITGKTSRVPKCATAGAALWGNYLAYLAVDGSVWRKNLSTGHAVEVVKPVASYRKNEGPQGEVELYGDHVAWSYRYTDKKLKNHVVNSYVDLSTPTHVQQPPPGYTVHALTSDGAVFWNDEAGQFKFAGYGAGSKPTDLAGPTDDVAIDSSVMTWLNDGVVESAPLPVVADQPRALGAPVAPASIASSTSASWAAYFPYSAALTSCSLRITRGSSLLRTLPCDPADMSSGGAYITWDGRKSDGKRVTAGAVSWTLTAANDDGPSLAPGGAAKPLTGTIRVVR